MCIVNRGGGGERTKQQENNNNNEKERKQGKQENRERGKKIWVIGVENQQAIHFSPSQQPTL